ncbi:MAG: YdcF family protein [Bacteroidales bacterium]|jgi:uncharacterized SAM-binding protein YcdF (DUF218 family)
MKSDLKRKLGMLLFFLLLMFVMTSCAFSSRTCTRFLKESMKDPYEIVIVPGVPFENGKWSFIMKGRVCWSKYLYDRGITKNIIYSGAAVYSPYCEAEIMALYAEKLGVPAEHIFVEIKAQHSTENVYYSYKKAKKLGFTRIALASDPFQTKMLKRFVKKVLGREVGLIPMVIDSLGPYTAKIVDPEIDYQKAFVKNFIALPSRENLFKRFRGTEGFEIDTTSYK